MTPVRIAITMDCEPTLATTHGSATGPADFAMSERAITGYWEIAAERGFPVTYFVHPETIRVQADLFRDLQSQGACIGLHVHPWKYSQWRHGGVRYMAHWGALSYDEQVSLLAETAVLWQDAMGARPLLFRPGTFSANDATFRAMAAAGFKGGSISAADRVFREIYAVWTGADPDPHRTHPEFRVKAGSMDLVDVPLSVDLAQPVDYGQGRKLHADLRPDIDWAGRYGITARSVAGNLLTQLAQRAPAVPTITTVSHNQFEYRDRSDPVCARFLVMLDALQESLSRAGVDGKGTTIDEVVDRVLETEPAEDKFLYI